MTEKAQKYLELVKDEVDKLSGLLANPEPELFAWGQFFGASMNRLTELWKNGLPKDVDTPTTTTL